MRHQDCTAEPCKHGQVACPCASACQVADDDQTESADAEVVRMLVKGACLFAALMFAAWALAPQIAKLIAWWVA